MPIDVRAPLLAGHTVKNGHPDAQRQTQTDGNAERLEARVPS